jgi:hypothetical protein
MSTEVKAAPAGFTPEQWKTFSCDGLVHIPDVLPPDTVDELLKAALECLEGLRLEDEHTNKVENVIAHHPAFHQLIDHSGHIGFVYDVFGDQLRLSQNDVFCRPPGSVVNHWHIDGPRAVPYRAFSPVLPLKMRVGYWLTDVPRDDMANMVYLPGSHRPEYTQEHAGTGALTGQQVLTPTKGSLTVFNGNLWHRIQPNTSEVTRVNVFLSYTPSWINGYYFHDVQAMPGLTREQRIVLRPYGDVQEGFSRPPGEDQPLYSGGLAVDTGLPVERHKVRRLTRYEQYLREHDC